MTSFWNMLQLELRNGLRQLTRRTAHSALIVAVLATGLGATLFVLVVIDALVLRPMPFPDAERLVQIGESDHNEPGFLDAMNSQDLLDLRAALTRFDAVESFSGGTMNLSDGKHVERYDGQFVSGGLFSLIDVDAQIGRTLNADDDRPGAPARVVISDRVWRQRFAASPDVLGQIVRINMEPAEIIGVMPAGFAFPFVSDVWTAARDATGQPETQQRDAVIEQFTSGAVPAART